MAANVYSLSLCSKNFPLLLLMFFFNSSGNKITRLFSMSWINLGSRHYLFYVHSFLLEPQTVNTNSRTWRPCLSGPHRVLYFVKCGRFFYILFLTCVINCQESPFSQHLHCHVVQAQLSSCHTASFRRIEMCLYI